MLALSIRPATATPPTGDINGDGKVDITDVALVGSALGSTAGLPRWKAEYDINTDGVINIADVIIVATHYGEGSS